MAPLFARVLRGRLACFTTVVLCAAHAHADETPPSPDVVSAPTEGERTASAREAFVRGVELAKVGRWNEARAAFEESDWILPNAITKYNVGFCARALGLYARAEQAFESALVEDAHTHALPEDLRASAQKFLTESSKRRSSAVLVADSEMRLLVDGRPLEALPSSSGEAVYLAGSRAAGPPEPLSSGRVTLRLDPGMHVFEVTRAGRSEPAVVATFSPGELRVLHFETTAAKSSNAITDGTHSSPFTWPVIATGSVGVASVLTGSVFGILALTTHSALSGECRTSDGSCTGNQSSEITRLHTYEDVATTGFVVGGVALAAAGVLLLTHHEAPANPARGSVRVRVFPGGVSGVF